MIDSLRRALMIGIAMLAASGFAVAMKPTHRIAEEGPKLDLESMIPRQFGDWRIDSSIAPIQVSPDVKAKLDQVYDQTLSRTYVNENGQRVMLSIAYGGNHGEGMQTHRPEICYPAQGFTIDKSLGRAVLQSLYGGISVNRLVASLGARVEPITYWVVVGSTPTEFGLSMKLAQLRYNLTGTIPDGLLVRVSSIDRNEVGAYELQETFVLRLLDALPEQERLRLIGKV